MLNEQNDCVNEGVGMSEGEGVSEEGVSEGVGVSEGAGVNAVD